ncbi:MAG: DUF3413 domain-containing protein [Bacteroidales bacterium]|nr:DUF3413 domain-containing protein [Bacteroidales bacterium]
MTLKNSIQKNFIYFCCSSVVIAIQFFLYLANSPQLEYMDVLGHIFFVGAVLSHAAIFALVPYILGCIAALATKNETISSITHITGVVILNIVFFINSYVFSLYRFHINGLIISMFFSEGSDEIFQFDTSLYLKTAAIILGIIVGNIVLKKVCDKFFEKFQRTFFLPFLLVFLTALISSNAIHAYAAVAQKQSVIKSASHLPYYFPVTATRLMIKLGVVSQDDLLHADFGEQTGLCYPKNEIQSERFDTTNIVIIAIDSWNYRALNETIMPYTWDYANRNELFTNHLSSSNGTRGSIFGMFYGVSSYYWKDFDVTGTTPVMIDELNKRNITIRTYPSATLNNPNFAKLLFHKTPGIRPSTEGNSVYERDCRLTQNFVDFLDSTTANEPFFAFLFYDLAHSFEFPEYLQKKFTPSWDFADYMKLNNDMDPTPYWNLYCNCINVVDSLVHVALSAIEAKNLDKNTLIFITGDHGQEFNENHKNYWGHGSNYTYPQIHIPLIVHKPNGNKALYSHRTTHYDISTTVLQDILGVTNNCSDYGMGRNLYDTTFRNWHIVGDNLNYAFIVEDNTIVEKKPSGALEIYDKDLNPTQQYKPSAKDIEASITAINAFYQSK